MSFKGPEYDGLLKRWRKLEALNHQIETEYSALKKEIEDTQKLLETGNKGIEEVEQLLADGYAFAQSKANGGGFFPKALGIQLPNMMAVMNNGNKVPDNNAPIKVILMGHLENKKGDLLSALLSDDYKMKHPAIGSCYIEYEVAGRQFQIWDTLSIDKYPNMPRGYFKGTDIVLMYGSPDRAWCLPILERCDKGYFLQYTNNKCLLNVMPEGEAANKENIPAVIGRTKQEIKVIGKSLFESVYVLIESLPKGNADLIDVKIRPMLK